MAKAHLIAVFGSRKLVTHLSTDTGTNGNARLVGRESESLEKSLSTGFFNTTVE
jgi:hypothetical protein